MTKSTCVLTSGTLSRVGSPLILGLDICYDGILLTTDYQGRSSGEAFVRFSNRTSAERALERNKERIGHRWEYLTPKGFKRKTKGQRSEVKRKGERPREKRSGLVSGGRVVGWRKTKKTRSKPLSQESGGVRGQGSEKKSEVASQSSVWGSGWDHIDSGFGRVLYGHLIYQVL